MTTIKSLILFFALFIQNIAFAAAPEAAKDTVEFNRDIRPIISEKCFFCHGPDKADQKAGLRLDQREAAEEVLFNGELLARINETDPDEVMPPPETNHKLSADDKAMIKAWIEQGAEYQEHWAYEAPAQVDVPADGNPIDHFINRTLDENEITPSETADPSVLARRLSLDLTGLPPDSATVAAFVENTEGSPAERWQELIETLLDSPHYGERMAVYWLDLVRYADTVGFHGDQNMAVSPYRDYVIKSFNENLSFDQFTREQIAGDLLEDPTEWQMIATAYNRLNKKTNEGGAQALEYQVKNAGDRVRTTSTVWLGGTLGCAECHDHKFDPYSQKDFYTFAAYFADVEDSGYWGRNGHKDGIWGANLKITTDEQDAEIKATETRLAEVKVALNAKPEGWQEAHDTEVAKLREKIAGNASDWILAKLTDLKSKEGVTMKDLGDGSWLSTGKNPNTDTYTFTLSPDAHNKGQPLSAFLIEALNHETLTRKASSRGNGNFVLTSVDAKAADGKPVVIAEAGASFEQNGWPVKNTLNNDVNNGWAVNGHAQIQDNEAWFRFKQPVSEPVTIRLRFESGHTRHIIGRLRVSTTSVAKPQLSSQEFSPSLAAAVTAEKPSSEQGYIIKDYIRENSLFFAELRKERGELQKKLEDLKNAGRTVLITKKVKPRVVRILNRGNWMDKEGEVVQPAVPHFLPGFEEAPVDPSRLGLANWLVSEENPLTARVFVNRLWKMYFGTGLSKVLDDLGSQGELPTHPELLDWLANEFIRSGWDVKHMVKLIVSSETYQRASLARRDLAEIDPYNRLLAHQSPIRLDAEMVRDNALAISGLLVRDIGGDSARPYQPGGYYRELNFPRRTYKSHDDQNQFRRGLYTHWQRTFLHPMLKAFDAPDREECTANRTMSNTPTQSLVLLNDPTFVEAARRFAQRMLEQDGDFAKRLDWAFQEALARPVRDREREILSAYHAKQLAHFGENKAAAKELLATGLSSRDEALPIVEHAAMMSVARAILNLHETITRY